MFPMWMDNGLNPLISICQGRDTLAIAVRHLSDLHQAWWADPAVPVHRPETGHRQAFARFALSLLAFCASSPCPCSHLARGVGRDESWKPRQPHYLRVIRLDGLPARGPALDGLHGCGVERLLAERPLLIGRALGTLRLPLPLLLVDVVHTQEQAVVHDLEALQHLPSVYWGESVRTHTLSPSPCPQTWW